MEQSDRERLIRSGLEWAAKNLGPSCYECLRHPSAQASYWDWIWNGREIEDAVLATVHSRMSDSPPVKAEFVQYFVAPTLAMGRRRLSPAMRRLWDSGDLAQSMWEDLLPRLAEFEFRDRSSFLSFLSRRLRWKLADKVRNFRRVGGREDLRTTLEDGMVFGDPKVANPLSDLVTREEKSWLAARLAELPEMDRKLLRFQLQGKSYQEMSRDTGIPMDELSKALRRAMRRLNP